MFLFLLSLLLLINIIIIIIESFFYTVVASPLPPYLNSAALSGLLMVKKKISFAIKGIVMSFLHQNLLISLFQPCWLFFLMTLTESRLLSVFFIDRFNKIVN